MKILHFSDTHLGFHDLDIVGKNGINLREQDVYDAFEHVIDQALELKPDLVIHSGDFFHRPSPANRPMIFAMDQLSRLGKANIPIVIIAGNHSTPRTIYTSPILKAFRSIDGVFPIFDQKYDYVEFGEVVIHGLPHINDEKVQLDEMNKIKPIAGKRNILMLHTSIGRDYIMEEYGEQLFPKERYELLNQFDYLALGHWHNLKKISQVENGWYCGSTERFSDTEAGKDKGFLWLDVQDGKAIEPEFIPIPTRTWHKVEIDKCENKLSEEIEKELLDTVGKLDLKDAILSIHFNKITPMKSIQFSRRRIHELIEGPIYIGIRRHFVDMSEEFSTSIQKTERLDKLFESYIHTKVDNKDRAKKLLDKARYYFDHYETNEPKA